MASRLTTIACAVMLVAAGPNQNNTGATPDPITEWSVAAAEAAAAAAMSPFRTPITLAILHLAMYDAVNAVTQEREPYFARAAVVEPASPHAAAIEAGYRVLLTELPTERPALTARYQRLLAAIPDSQAKTNGAKLGALVASRALEARANDQRNQARVHTAGTGAGVWVPTPPAFRATGTAFLAAVVPFTMTSAAQFRPAGPPALTSSKWAEEYDEVKRLGGKQSATRTAAQTATAHFWEPLAGTVWPATIRRLAVEQKLDLPASAHFQAAAFAAFADGLIACWEAKFRYNFWRPVTAVQRGDQDGNDRTGPRRTRTGNR